MPVTNAFGRAFSLWTLLVLVLQYEAKCCAALSPDGLALLYFRSRIEDDPNDALSNWNGYDEDPCNWFGVRCLDGKVVSINLTGLSLKGILAPELGELTSLRELFLRENDFTGAIPVEFGELEKLEVLDLAINNLTGQMPQDLGNLSSLNRLYLENNSLEGIIPPELGNLINLYELRVNMNKLTGTIPGNVNSTPTTTNNCLQLGGISVNGLCNLKHLQLADFSGNYFEGKLPTCFQHLPRSSFNHNCLTSDGILQQRSSEDCMPSPSSGGFMHRALLQAPEGSAGVPGGSTNSSGPAVGPAVGQIAQAPLTPSPTPSIPETRVTIVTPQPVSSPIASSPSPSSPSPSSPSPQNTPPEQLSPASGHTTAVVAAVSSAAVLVVLVIIVVILCSRHKGAAVRPWKSSMSGELQKGFMKGVPAISRRDLEAACEDFSNIIGSSPDIVLFKGTLANGTEIAVTSIRISAKSWSSSSELIFWGKVESLSNMKHDNLVNLLGYCAEEEPFVRMLVFEYVPNGTVFEHLHNKEAEHLDWATRMRIVMGVAYALEYMHHELDPPVTHMNLDSNAVYLTEDYAAKLADFGVWKASVSKKEPSKSPSEKGNSVGYDDLELSDRLVPDFENNVFSFGVFLLEVVSGRVPYCKQQGSLSDWAMNYLSTPELIACIVDPTLKEYNYEELEMIGKLALHCLQIDTARGLTMKQITSHLSSVLGTSKEAAVPKSSPLLWAELEILSQE